MESDATNLLISFTVFETMFYSQTACSQVWYQLILDSWRTASSVSRQETKEANPWGGPSKIKLNEMEGISDLSCASFPTFPGRKYYIYFSFSKVALLIDTYLWILISFSFFSPLYSSFKKLCSVYKWMDCPAFNVHHDLWPTGFIQLHFARAHCFLMFQV